jgi:UDP-N-acetyl-2-amino-2-deoxyglucuronate dehydrogenase
MSRKRFCLIGLAGYIAPRHLKAIRDVGGELVAALDKSDSVGIIDSYFPEASFFTEFERFDRYVDKLRREGNPIDYLVICTPNYLHDAHIRWGLRAGMDVICEKPLVLNPWNLDAIREIEEETGKKVYNILQLRVHPEILKLKNKIDKNDFEKQGKHEINLIYITSRGKWYYYSWKGDMEKSGGVATNIGIHFFDMLLWIFGDVLNYEVHYVDPIKKMAGYFELEKAKVHWFLSIEGEDLPEKVKNKGQRTYRSIQVDEEEIEFSSGFTELHSEVYKNILDGKGYRIDIVKPSIDLVYKLRNEKNITGINENSNWLAKEKLNAK